MPVHPSPHGSSMDLFGPVHPNGYQINIILKKGTGHDFVSTDVRMKPEETMGTLKKRVAKKLDMPMEQMQLFFNDRELKPTPHAVNGTVYDECSLDDLYMGAGTTLYGYDLSETPDYWPKRYNAAKETLEYLPEFEPPKKKEPVAQMMPEVEPLQGPSLYSRSRAIYTTELDSAQQRSQTGELDPGTDKPGNAERGILPGRWDEDRHPFLGSAAGQQFVTGKPNPTPLC